MRKQVIIYGNGNMSRSVRAEEAEVDGKLPKIRLIALLRAAGIKGATKLVAELRPCEWHHTGCYAQKTNYYNPAELPAGIHARLTTFLETREAEEAKEAQKKEEACRQKERAQRRETEEMIAASPFLLRVQALCRKLETTLVGNARQEYWRGVLAVEDKNFIRFILDARFNLIYIDGRFFLPGRPEGYIPGSLGTMGISTLPAALRGILETALEGKNEY